MKIFLDEAGDLGFDFSKSRTTRFFVIALLVTPDDRPLRKAVERTIRHKINRGRKPKRAKSIREMKGTHTSFAVKGYFWKQVRSADFALYTLAVNKDRVNKSLRKVPDRLYNYVTRLLLQRCPLGDATDRVILTIDRSKNKAEQADFNRYLTQQVQALLPPEIPLNIYHAASESSAGIQAADLFCWGIFRKYEVGDETWYQVFQEKILCETLFLPPK